MDCTPGTKLGALARQRAALVQGVTPGDAPSYNPTVKTKPRRTLLFQLATHPFLKVIPHPSMMPTSTCNCAWRTYRPSMVGARSNYQRHKMSTWPPSTKPPSRLIEWTHSTSSTQRRRHTHTHILGRSPQPTLKAPKDGEAKVGDMHKNPRQTNLHTHGRPYRASTSSQKCG